MDAINPDTRLRSDINRRNSSGPHTIWTNTRIELLKAHWAAGMSCRLIAIELGGGLTRNAVIGKIHRLGLGLTSSERSERQARDNYRPNRIRRSATRRNPIVKARLARPNPIFEADPLKRSEISTRSYWPYGPCSIVELAADSCRWAVTDDKPHLFCNAPGYPYCSHHAALAINQRSS